MKTVSSFQNGLLQEQENSELGGNDLRQEIKISTAHGKGDALLTGTLAHYYMYLDFSTMRGHPSPNTPMASNPCLSTFPSTQPKGPLPLLLYPNISGKRSLHPHLHLSCHTHSPKPFVFSSIPLGRSYVSKTRTKTFIPIIAYLGYALEGGQWDTRENLIYLLGWFIQKNWNYLKAWGVRTQLSECRCRYYWEGRGSKRRRGRDPKYEEMLFWDRLFVMTGLLIGEVKIHFCSWL